MEQEFLSQILASLKILWVAGFSFLYGWGGISGKWRRRYLGAAWMMLGVFGFSMQSQSWNWWYLTYLPLLIGVLSMGYGAEKLTVKIKRRSLVAAGYAFSPIALAIISQMWLVWLLHTVLCFVVTVTLGVFNPMRNPRDEETMVGTIAVLMPLFMLGG